MENDVKIPVSRQEKAQSGKNSDCEINGSGSFLKLDDGKMFSPFEKG
jgi:hypothetical protein